MKIDISEGYQTGLIARITEMHAKFYALHWGFGRAFAVVVASGLADFVSRLDHPLNNIWVATSGDKIVGSVAIDGEDMGAQWGHSGGKRCWSNDLPDFFEEMKSTSASTLCWLECVKSR
jgi:hypothetical protein